VIISRLTPAATARDSAAHRATTSPDSAAVCSAWIASSLSKHTNGSVDPAELTPALVDALAPSPPADGMNSSRTVTGTSMGSVTAEISWAASLRV